MTGAAEPGSRPGPVTAVQLRDDAELFARFFSGTPSAKVSAARGNIVLLPAGQVAAYVIRRPADDRRVHLSNRPRRRAHHRSGRERAGSPLVLEPQTRRLQARPQLIRNLTRYGYDPSDLSDDFWLRAGGAFMARRRPARQLLSYLLAGEATCEAARLRDWRCDAR